MTTLAPSPAAAVVDALATVPDLGFVRSVTLDDDGVVVHLRAPAVTFRANDVCLVASDYLDALRLVEGIGRVRVSIDGHPDSAIVDAGSADEGPNELQDIFLRRAHTAAMERSVAAHRALTGDGPEIVRTLTLRDIRRERFTTALLRRRSAIGLSICPNSRVAVDEHGRPIAL
jgi:hypothetical protein